MPTQTLHILWTTGDPDTANFMVLLYATSCLTQDWWDEVTVVIWGAAVKLLAENSDVQERLRMAMHAGVHFSACGASARQQGVAQNLEALGIEMKGWGYPLSILLRQGLPLLTV